jgi:hypothetical protein
MGSVQDRSTTATENSIIAAGVAVGLEEYIANFSTFLPDAATFTFELLDVHFADWADDAMNLGIVQQEVSSPCIWEPNGKSPGNTPGAKLQALSQIAQAVEAFANIPPGNPTGIDPYNYIAALVANSGLTAADNIQIPRQQMEQQQMQAQMSAMAQQQQGNPGAGGGAGPGGGAPPPGYGAPPGQQGPPGEPLPQVQHFLPPEIIAQLAQSGQMNAGGGVSPPLQPTGGQGMPPQPHV